MFGQYERLTVAKAWLTHQRERQLSMRGRLAYYRDLERTHPSLFSPGSSAVEEQHRALWQDLRRGFSPLSLRLFGNLSGNWDPRLVPLEAYTSEIERVLNPEPESAFLAHKSLYGRWFSDGLFPRCYLHDVDGILFDERYRPRQASEVEAVLSECIYPLVIKPNIHSKGGHDIAFATSFNGLCEHLKGRKNYVVQERIKQNAFFDRFNAYGLNTLRCCVYRSLRDEAFHVLSVSLRMGRVGHLDNLAQGGMVCAVHADGGFQPYAVDDHGNKYLEHPDSGIRFDSIGVLPKYAELVSMLRNVAAQLWFHRLVSFDVAFDNDSRWRLIEINLRGQTISFSQFAGLPFFGEFTDEVIAYCLQNRPWRRRLR